MFFLNTFGPYRVNYQKLPSAGRIVRNAQDWMDRAIIPPFLVTFSRISRP